MIKKLAFAAVLALAVLLFFLFDLDQWLSFQKLQQSQALFKAWFAESPWLVGGAFFGIYVAVTALSLPGAAVMTLAAGALFGLLTGTILVTFASSIGATLAFLVARFLLHDWVQRRFGERLAAINRGVEREGAFYLFTLRLVPAFPFVLVNILMALTPIRALTFYWVSQLGMLPGTIVYVLAGTQLAQLESPGDILSPGLIASFTLLGIFPLAARQVVKLLERRKNQTS